LFSECFPVLRRETSIEDDTSNASDKSDQLSQASDIDRCRDVGLVPDQDGTARIRGYWSSNVATRRIGGYLADWCMQAMRRTAQSMTGEVDDSRSIPKKSRLEILDTDSPLRHKPESVLVWAVSKFFLDLTAFDI
jgi:hypothetical protein